jgi:AraC-like DNA-binding protein
LLDTLSRRSSFLLELRDVFEQNFRNPDFDLAQMAAAMGVSERQLQRKLNALTGYTPAEHLRACRLHWSIEVLQHQDSIGATARAVGFSSQTYFTSCFKTQFGTTPKQVQQGLLNP